MRFGQIGQSLKRLPELRKGMEDIDKDLGLKHLRLLVRRMARKGMGVDTIPRLIMDVGTILIDSKYASFNLVNERLVHCGWGESVLDETSLGLIIIILENQVALKVKKKTLH